MEYQLDNCFKTSLVQANNQSTPTHYFRWVFYPLNEEVQSVCFAMESFQLMEEVYGGQGYANTSQWHEAVYYGSPLDVFDNEADVAYPNEDAYTYNSTYYQDPNLSGQHNYYGAPQSSSFSGGYVFDSQDQSYDYGTYHYEYYPVYYVYPTYPGYYALTNPEYSPENVYSAYYVYVPVNIYYYVPYFVYYLSTSTDNVNDVIYEVDSSQSYESDVLSSPREQSFDDSQEFDSKFYNIGNISLADILDNCKEIVGEGITTCYLFHGEYPQTLNDAPVDDEAKSMSSNEKLENEAEENKNITVNEEPNSIEANICEDDVDRNVIKKISSMSIDDVKEDIDDNYENAKAFVYREVLKGYTEIKNQLEELDWECHSLEDILEEEEPESDASEIDFNENVAEVLENMNLLPDEDEESYFESVACSENSQLYSNVEDLVEDHQTMMMEAEPSVDSSVVEEKDETDPVLELSLNKENICSGSLNAIEEHNPPVDPSLVEDKDETDPVLKISSSKENICNGSLNSIEEHYPLVDPSAVEEKDKIGPFLEQALSKEELYTEPLNTFQEHCGSGKSSVEEKDKLDSVSELSLREEKFESGSRSNIEEHHKNLPSQDRGEERLESDPDVIAAAASKEIQRKKRFSGLRKFLARMCCCAKKRS